MGFISKMQTGLQPRLERVWLWGEQDMHASGRCSWEKESECINPAIAEPVNPSAIQNLLLPHLGFAGWVLEEGAGSRQGGQSWKVR